MKKINLLYCLILIIVLNACRADASTQIVQKPDNYVVLLDLSDRLLQPGQAERDKSVITAVFEKFEAAVDKNLRIKSKDRFSLRIIPQDKSPLLTEKFENELSLNLSGFNAAERSEAFNAFKNIFVQKISDLYQNANQGDKTDDYKGAKTWSYFKDQLNSDLQTGYNNFVIVLTDGHFDYEDPQYGKLDSFRITSNPILKKLSGSDWRTVLTQENVGLTPVNLEIGASYQICGIQPKNADQNLEESKKLIAIWEQWLLQSGKNRVLNFIQNSSSKKMREGVLNY